MVELPVFLTVSFNIRLLTIDILNYRVYATKGKSNAKAGKIYFGRWGRKKFNQNPKIFLPPPLA
jgi:hypothetical protein